MSASLAGKKIFITGASRGIGLAIAKRAAQDGAMVAIAAKTTEPHPKLPGTIFSAAEEIEAAGGKALPIQCDLRDETQIEAAVAQAVAEFGGLDILINNAGVFFDHPITHLANPSKAVRSDVLSKCARHFSHLPSGNSCAQGISKSRSQPTYLDDVATFVDEIQMV